MKRDPKNINAQPTKDLFISMLTKDLPLEDAISDLVDNSVDGARRIHNNQDYKDQWVRIEAMENHFKIDDNCGGITVDDARKYAFRFGRAEDMPQTPGSIGRFGIGMKRALFKLGNNFRVVSTTKNSKFVVEVDVNEWKEKEEEEWQFVFRELEEGLKDVPTTRRGTSITVTSLDKSVSQSFGNTFFVNRLIKELELHHLFSIDKGLEIRINGHRLKTRSLLVLQSKELKPAYWEYTFDDQVKVKAYAGIHTSDLEAGGWYIFCNGRLVLGPDQTLTTGWGDREIMKIPKYHGQYDRFRGYIFFDSDDAALLPWNTTKTSVDVDSPKWKYVRAEMIKLMRPVCDFLNKIHQERQRKDAETDEGPLEKAVEAAKPVELSSASTSKIFTAPKSAPKVRLPGMGRIQYYKSMDEINRVKQALRVQTLKEVGEKTFEYYLKTECE